MDNFVESLKLNYLLRYKDLDFEHSKQNFMRDSPILESFTEIRICQPDPEEDNAWNFVSTNSGTNDYNNSDTIKILIPVFKIQCAKPQIESFEINEELFISMILLVGGYLVIKKYPKDLLELNKLQACINWAINNARIEQDISFKDFDITLNIENSNGGIINNIKELTGYIEQLYHFEGLSVIAYEKVIPASNQGKENTTLLIPKIFKHKVIRMDDWLQNNIYLKIPYWIEKYKLNHGLIIYSDRIIISEKSAIEFSAMPSIKKIQKTKKEYFGKIDIHYRYRIVNEQIEITLYVNFKRTVNFENAVDKALKSESPYEKLSKVFSKYGYLICRKFTMGKRIDILSSEDSLMNEDASRSLIKRNTYVNDSDVWSKDFFKHPNSWDIVDRYEMIPITTLLEKEMQEQIKSVEANKHIIDCEIPIFRLKKRSYMMPYLKFANTFGKNNRTDNKERRKSIHKPFKILECLTKESAYYLESDNSEFFE
ncbi:hypothetical protein C2G38_2034100 [Gigaspora rosea]|uniref:Uncharacterized protein n=1 Tax=Gigaspora rosea TaxID=44941 RepID=A0A397VJ16_9GLOM|nr:hypothetical protein C2G38_2034100 [Gigaspora rosea]